MDKSLGEEKFSGKGKGKAIGADKGAAEKTENVVKFVEIGEDDRKIEITLDKWKKEEKKTENKIWDKVWTMTEGALYDGFDEEEEEIIQDLNRGVYHVDIDEKEKIGTKDVVWSLEEMGEEVDEDSEDYEDEKIESTSESEDGYGWWLDESWNDESIEVMEVIENDEDEHAEEKCIGETGDMIVMDEELDDEKDGCEINGEKYVEDVKLKQVSYDEKQEKIKLAAVVVGKENEVKNGEMARCNKKHVKLKKHVKCKNVKMARYNKKHVKLKPTVVFTWRGWHQ